MDPPSLRSIVPASQSSLASLESLRTGRPAVPSSLRPFVPPSLHPSVPSSLSSPCSLPHGQLLGIHNPIQPQLPSGQNCSSWQRSARESVCNSCCHVRGGSSTILSRLNLAAYPAQMRCLLLMRGKLVLACRSTVPPPSAWATVVTM